jgi:protein-arginine kinase activator protein McsA
MFKSIPPGTICSNCKKRPATIKWTGHSSATDINHGAPIDYWCAVCATQAQLEYYKEMAKQIPGLEKQLAELKNKE